MFTYFLVGEDLGHRQQRLSSSASSYAPERRDVNEHSDIRTSADEALQRPVEPGNEYHGWSEARRPPALRRYGVSCDLATDLTMDAIFPNFRRSLVASSKRRRFRNRTTCIDDAMSNSLQDCSVHDTTTRPLKRNGHVERT